MIRGILRRGCIAVAGHKSPRSHNNRVKTLWEQGRVAGWLGTRNNLDHSQIISGACVNSQPFPFVTPSEFLEGGA